MNVKIIKLYLFSTTLKKKKVFYFIAWFSKCFLINVNKMGIGFP
jgi:hypothetical protein